MLTKERIWSLWCKECESEVSTSDFVQSFARAIEGMVRAECVPPGYVVVPVNPTEAMLDAAIRAPLPAVSLDSHRAREHLIDRTHYKAMLAAAQGDQQ